MDKLTKDDRRNFISEIIKFQDKLFIPLHHDTIEYLDSLNDNKLFHYYIAHLELYNNDNN